MTPFKTREDLENKISELEHRIKCRDAEIDYLKHKIEWLTRATRFDTSHMYSSLYPPWTMTERLIQTLEETNKINKQILRKMKE